MGCLLTHIRMGAAYSVGRLVCTQESHLLTRRSHLPLSDLRKSEPGCVTAARTDANSSTLRAWPTLQPIYRGPFCLQAGIVALTIGYLLAAIAHTLIADYSLVSIASLGPAQRLIFIRMPVAALDLAFLVWIFIALPNTCAQLDASGDRRSLTLHRWAPHAAITIFTCCYSIHCLTAQPHGMLLHGST